MTSNVSIIFNIFFSIFSLFRTQVTTCPQCLNVFHSGLDHRTERLSDAEARCRAELSQFSEEISVRQNSCRINANKLEKMLGELQLQFEKASSTIAEVHNNYISMLEKRRDQAMEELGMLHSKQVNSVNIFFSIHPSSFPSSLK